jgi:acyl carrier protein
MLTTKDQIRQFVLEKFPAFHQKGLQDQESLIESGVFDSMGMLELVMFVESAFNIVVEDTDMTPENFESIDALSAFVESKKGN